MELVGLFFLAVAALLHIYIFALESLWWTTERARAIFGTSEEQAEETRELAFNQGVYNLCLAGLVLIGIAIKVVANEDFGLGLAVAGATVMVVAGFTLFFSSPEKARSALLQLTPPALGLVLLGVSRMAS